MIDYVENRNDSCDQIEDIESPVEEDDPNDPDYDPEEEEAKLKAPPPRKRRRKR